MKFTQDVLAMAMTVAPMLLVVLVVIAMLRERDQEKARNAAKAPKPDRSSGTVAVEPATVDALEAPSNN